MDILAVSSVVNFVAMSFVLYKVGKKPTVEFFRKRSETFSQTVEEAKNIYDQTDTQFKHWQGLWNQVDLEVNKLDKDAKSYIERLSTQTKTQTETKIAQIKKDGEALTQNEITRAKENLQNQIALSAIEEAKDLVNKKLNTQEKKDLVKQALEICQSA